LDEVSAEMSALLGTNAKVMITGIRAGRLRTQDSPNSPTPQGGGINEKFYKLTGWQVDVAVYRDINFSLLPTPATIIFDADAIIHTPHLYLEISGLWAEKVQSQSHGVPTSFYIIGGVPLIYGTRANYQRVDIILEAVKTLAKTLAHITTRRYDNFERWANDFFQHLSTLLQNHPPLIFSYKDCSVEVRVTSLPEDDLHIGSIEVSDPIRWGKNITEKVTVKHRCSISLKIKNKDGRVLTSTTPPTSDLCYFLLTVSFTYTSDKAKRKGHNEAEVKIELIHRWTLEIDDYIYTPPWNQVYKEILFVAKYPSESDINYLPDPAVLFSEKDAEELLRTIKICLISDVLDTIIREVFK